MMDEDHEAGAVARWVEPLLPASFSEDLAGAAAWQWIALLVLVPLAYGAARIIAGALLAIGNRVAARTKGVWDDELVTVLRGPLRGSLFTVVAWLGLDALAVAGSARVVMDHALRIVLVFTLAWLVARLVRLGGEILIRRAKHAAGDDAGNDLRLRGVRTQVYVLRRVITIVIGIVAVSLVLLQFEVVRSVGISLLASAGMAGIVIGLAAQRSIATLLAGIQISITQPIRIGDTVIVENEWGQIEEINLTYVVVKIWDERRLVVPIGRFLDAPFQNWTKVSPQLLGTVFFHADYSLPIEGVRAELDRILEGNPLWDGRTKGVVVTDAKDRTLEVRALVSAQDASKQWDLRCQVREGLVAWLRQHEGGRHLPRVRVEDPGARPTSRDAAAS